ncbi:Lar family restriction alleviation protein [Thalassovita sp.]|uniref:Lar family restriction alleviation protein n=1 Tax=Thalassovita sp. TaxID=1979401 RepID=UPI003B63ED5C
MAGYIVEIDNFEFEIAPCPFCGSKPQVIENAHDAFGFRCTCGGKRFVQTYFDSKIADRAGRIQSAVAAWNCRPPVLMGQNSGAAA